MVVSLSGGWRWRGVASLGFGFGVGVAIGFGFGVVIGFGVINYNLRHVINCLQGLGLCDFSID